MAALLAAGLGWTRARRRARLAGHGPLPRRLIVQVTTTGTDQAAEHVLARVRALPSPVPLELWVIVDEGTRTSFRGADRILVVPRTFRCRTRAKGRALEFARRQRLLEGIADHETKILLLDDDSAPTASYLRMAVEADADLAQGMLAARNHYGRTLSHLDDLRPLHCLAVCSWAQGSGRPVHVHGEGLCIRASAEHAVGWDTELSSLAEDLMFGQRAAAAGLSWAFLPAVVEITSPWSAAAFLTQRRRWSWGTMQALPRLPVEAAIRVLGFYAVTLAAFALSVLGTILTVTGERSIAGPWAIGLAAWLGLFALAGWIGSGGRARQSLLAVLLAWPSALANALVVPFSLALGPPRGFRTIAKLPPASTRLAGGRLAQAPALALASVALLIPAALPLSSALIDREQRGGTWAPAVGGGESPDPISDGVLRSQPVTPRRPLAEAGSAPDLRRGMTVIAYGNDPYFRHKANRLMDRLAALGVTGVSLSVPIFTSGLDSNRVERDRELTPSESRIRAFAEAARRRGMTTTLSPLLDEKALAAEGGWRGALQPRDRRAWFASYARLLGRYAAIAERAGIHGLNVGTELESLQRDPGWRSVLERVRERFHGAVSYAMAGSRVLDPRPAWLLSNVDLIGINVWYPLDLPRGAGPEQIRAALAPWIEEIRDFDRRVDAPLVFTEAGGRSQEGAYRHPARPLPGGFVDPGAQSYVYEAVCGLRRRAGAEGVVWWATTLDPPGDPDADVSFDPLGKPAEERIRNCGSG